MNYYAFLLIMGILSILGAVIMVVIDKRKGIENENIIEKKQQELKELVKDAELMVNELNNFADYVVTEVDKKNSELGKSLKNYEERIEKLKQTATLEANKLNEIINISRSEQKLPMAVGSGAVNSLNFEKKSTKAFLPSLINVNEKNTEIKPEEKKEFAKIINFSSKHNEVIELLNKGMSEVEIAKSLKMGKGEVELIKGVVE